MLIDTTNLIYKGITIRFDSSKQLINITDIWKAEGGRSSKRPSNWIKLSKTQKLLEKVSREAKIAVVKDRSNGKIKLVSGVLETVKGGLLTVQGAFANFEIASIYAKILSNECYEWLQSIFVDNLESRFKELPTQLLDLVEDESLNEQPSTAVPPELTPDLVFALIESNQEFPVNFEDAWHWLEYSTKANARRTLVQNFEQGLDFSSLMMKSPQRGRPSEIIMLTVDCFKSMGMMAGTAKGKEVRRYFLDCEAELKRRFKQDAEQWHTQHKQRVVVTFVTETATTWKKRFKSEFFAEIYRVTGWTPAAAGHPPRIAWFIRKYVYEWFPEGVPERLDEVNPRINGRRKYKQHQHLKDPGLNYLTDQQKAVMIAMRLSPSGDLNQFDRNIRKALGETVQLELPISES